MATAAMDFGGKGQDGTTAMDQNQNHNRSCSPPAYYTMGVGPSNVAFGGPGSDPVCVQNNGGFMSHTAFVPTSRGGPTVLVTQPVVVGSAAPPETTCAMVMSALSAIFCGFWCGAAGILLTWRAKLHVLDKQYEHARHSLRVVWLFFAIACFFGALVWIGVGFYMYIILSLMSY